MALVAVALLAACAYASLPVSHPELAVAGARVESLIAPASSAAVSATASGSSPSPSEPPDPMFPWEVAGLPVISVADAVELLGSGQLDGQAVAVAGYYRETTPSCPYPGEYIGPLEDWCRFVAFADTRSGAQLCHREGDNGTSCIQPASGTTLAPFFENETSGNPWSWQTGGPTGEPAAFVLIGHAGDARQWQCTPTTQQECARAFVVDRIAWANGHDVPPAAPETPDLRTYKAVTPNMTLEQVAATLGLGDDLLTGAPFRRGDIATVDPRWNFAGDGIVWLVRSLGPAAEPGAEPRPETVWLVDDATGDVVDSHPLQLAADYQPARLWQMATVHGLDCCRGNELAFYRVESTDGTPVYDGFVPGGASGGSNSTTFGGSYGSTPLVLPAGDYAVTAWLAPYKQEVMGTPRYECSTQVTLTPLEDLTLNAVYPPNRACTFQPAPSPSTVP